MEGLATCIHSIHIHPLYCDLAPICQPSQCSWCPATSSLHSFPHSPGDDVILQEPSKLFCLAPSLPPNEIGYGRTSGANLDCCGGPFPVPFGHVASLPDCKKVQDSFDLPSGLLFLACGCYVAGRHATLVFLRIWGLEAFQCKREERGVKGRDEERRGGGLPLSLSLSLSLFSLCCGAEVEGKGKGKTGQERREKNCKMGTVHGTRNLKPSPDS